MVKDVEGLFATPPSARAHALFPHLPALHAQVALLRGQIEETAVEVTDDTTVETHLQTKAGYLASFLEFMDAEWEPL